MVISGRNVEKAKGPPRSSAPAARIAYLCRQTSRPPTTREFMYARKPVDL
jgi:hypothetical protein